MSDLRALVDALTSRLPTLEASGRRLAHAIYRELARGFPVTESVVADRAGLRPREGATLLCSWPDVDYDDHGRIAGFWGLSTHPTPHAFDVDSVHLYTWCAWDALFLPAILDSTAYVSSRDPNTRETIRLTVTPETVAERSHPDPVLSFVVPNLERATDIRPGFCHHVHFFTHRNSAEQWMTRSGATFVLDLETAFDLGQRRNKNRGLT